jgi:hypothetical protein
MRCFRSVEQIARVVTMSHEQVRGIKDDKLRRGRAEEVKRDVLASQVESLSYSPQEEAVIRSPAVLLDAFLWLQGSRERRRLLTRLRGGGC